MAKRFSLLYGALFVLVGLMGYIPNPIVGEGAFFATNPAHDWVHILIGIVLLWAGTQSHRTAYLSLMTFGVIYGLLAVIGYATIGAEGHTYLLGIVHINGNDNGLHVVLAVLLIGTALATRGRVHRPAIQH